MYRVYGLSTHEHNCDTYKYINYVGISCSKWALVAAQFSWKLLSHMYCIKTTPTQISTETSHEKHSISTPWCCAVSGHTHTCMYILTNIVFPFSKPIPPHVHVAPFDKTVKYSLGAFFKEKRFDIDNTLPKWLYIIIQCTCTKKSIVLYMYGSLHIHVHVHVVFSKTWTIEMAMQVWGTTYSNM